MFPAASERQRLTFPAASLRSRGAVSAASTSSRREMSGATRERQIGYVFALRNSRSSCAISAGRWSYRCLSGRGRRFASA